TRSGLTSVPVNYAFNHQYLLGATDQVGYAIPLELGGPAGEKWNIFPQDGAQVFKYRKLFVSEIMKHLMENDKWYVRLALNFFYENATVRRPAGIWYSMFKASSNGSEYRHGYIPVPAKSIIDFRRGILSKRQQPSRPLMSVALFNPEKQLKPQRPCNQSVFNFGKDSQITARE
ncbi:unnamed protein product, partial [Allacma fusca]